MKAAKRQRIFDRDGNKCVQCSRSLFLTIDHIIPVSYGGSDADDNLQTLCSDCNHRKADTLPEGVTAKRRIRRRIKALTPKLSRQSAFNFKHHRYCDVNYCFVECEIFLTDHPQLRSAITQ